jgi:import inner membrane translocase subunit TIM54
MHAAPSPLPPQAPLVLVPFTCHLGFKQIPYMIYDFFTESRRVQQGAEVAYALIMNHTRPFTIPTESDHPDTDFAADTEQFYTKSYATIPEKNEKAKGVYYKELGERLESARQFARGERDLTDAEKKSDKPVTTEDDLKEERKKREMRWNGGLEGWNIVKAETPVAWDPTWAGWLRVVDPEVKDE